MRSLTAPHEDRLAEHAAPSVTSPYQLIDLIVSDNRLYQHLASAYASYMVYLIDPV